MLLQLEKYLTAWKTALDAQQCGYLAIESRFC